VWRYNIRLQKAAKHAAVPKYRTVVVFCGQQTTCSWMIDEHNACTPLNDTRVRLTTVSIAGRPNTCMGAATCQQQAHAYWDVLTGSFTPSGLRPHWYQKFRAVCYIHLHGVLPPSGRKTHFQETFLPGADSERLPQPLHLHRRAHRFGTFVVPWTLTNIGLWAPPGARARGPGVVSVETLASQRGRYKYGMRPNCGHTSNKTHTDTHTMACKVSTSKPSTAEFRTVCSPMIRQSVKDELGPIRV
jgi:hypothetical protein